MNIHSCFTSTPTVAKFKKKQNKTQNAVFQKSIVTPLLPGVTFRQVLVAYVRSSQPWRTLFIWQSLLPRSHSSLGHPKTWQAREAAGAGGDAVVPEKLR